MALSATKHEKEMNAMASEEELRANVYSLLATLLAKSPDIQVLHLLMAIDADDSIDNDTARAWAGLKEAALEADEKQLAEEYQNLFIGIGRGELVPYGSWYMTGFLMEKPLGDLRMDLRRLGFERQDEVQEPEDHVAALCDVMAMLIRDKSRYGFEEEKKFFNHHMACWMDRFFNDLKAAENARFYRALGELGVQVMNIDDQYYAMAV